jgi:hypothetical protein
VVVALILEDLAVLLEQQVDAGNEAAALVAVLLRSSRTAAETVKPNDGRSSGRGSRALTPEGCRTCAPARATYPQERRIGV